MVTVKEFREWLKQFPDDTEVNVAVQEESPLYESYGAINFQAPVLDDTACGSGWEYTDFTGNQFVKPDSPFYNKRVLDLGENA